MTKVGMVLEGGALRGLYSAGVLDVLMEEQIKIDGIIGVSAGALFGVNYFTNQKGRAIRYNKKYCNDKRYMSINSLMETGNIVNRDFAFYRITKELDPLDNDMFLKNGKDYYATVTNVETGQAEYLKITNPVEQLEELRATSAIPIVSQIINIDNKKYLDGGIADSIPIDKCQSLGYDKIIVILTQPLDYRKEKISKLKMRCMKIKYRKYPNLLEAIRKRHLQYNATIEKIIRLEKEEKIFVIRPSQKINIKLTEKNADKLQEVYELGVREGKKIVPSLKEYLHSSISS